MALATGPAMVGPVSKVVLSEDDREARRRELLGAEGLFPGELPGQQWPRPDGFATVGHDGPAPER
ncbi:hypothetical protein ABN034_09325 [Actinopolymorpha sp. B11F2]|uniref:hypothetical protein n=1 Tax=Actinopolymorpha sp. B11F2 TaxID=3160862 RepID=UPI0032E4C536